MTTKAKPLTVHSPLPWKLSPYGEQSGSLGLKCEIVDASGKTVADNEKYYPQAVTPEDQSLIITAVNAHAALVSLVKRYRSDAIEQGAEAADLLDIDAALRLSGEDI